MLTLVEFRDSGPVLVSETVEKIRNQVGNSKVAVISTFGKFRQGKSFLSNVLLKQLENPSSLYNEDTVIGGEDGIAFQRGQTAHTKGIHVWNKVFRQTIDGEKVAVLLMDTQGTFDTRSNSNVSVQIFCISNLLSSMQIFNVKDMVSGQDIEALQLFVNCSAEVEQKAGQNFYFLIRDFLPDSDDYTYGEDEEYFSKVLEQISASSELSTAMENVRNSFNQISCFTLPPPSDEVRRANGKVKIKDCGYSFISSIRQFTSKVLSSLQVKVFKGNEVRGNSYFDYLESIVTNCREGTANEIRNAFQTAKKLSVQKATAKGLEVFNECLYNVRSDISIGEYLRELEGYQDKAVEFFLSIGIIGNADELINEVTRFECSIQIRKRELYEKFRDWYVREKIDTICAHIYDYYIEHIQIPYGNKGIPYLDEEHDNYRSECTNRFLREAEELYESAFEDPSDETIVELLDREKSHVFKRIKSHYEFVRQINAEIVGRYEIEAIKEELFEEYRKEARRKLSDSARNFISESYELREEYEERLREKLEEYDHLPEIVTDCIEEFYEMLRNESYELEHRAETIVEGERLERVKEERQRELERLMERERERQRERELERARERMDPIGTFIRRTVERDECILM